METNSFEIGLSYHHHHHHHHHHMMLCTILKTKIEMFQPKKLVYNNFKQFDSDQFKLDIFNSISDVRTHAAFENSFVSILDKHTLQNTKPL